ncbi:MAG TPA: M48 family metalloprotease [Xanthobacteraceae bacterium]
MTAARWMGLLAALASAIAYADAPVAVPTATQAAIAFSRHREPLWAAAQLLPSLIACFVLFTGLGARMRGSCARLARGGRFWTVTLFACAYVILAALITMPFDYYRDVVDLRSWGELNQSPAQWLAGEVVGVAVKLIVAGLFIWIPYALIARSPRRWWLYSTLALVPVAFLVLVALPVWVSPLTTTYMPLADKALVSKIETLAARCGVAHIPVFVGGNEDTVVGLGPTNRIVLNKDIFKNETADQVEFTIGHELKHYVEGDNWKALAIVTGLMLSGFFLVDRLGRALIARFSGRIGFGDLKDPASLPLIVLIFSLFWLSVSPLFNLFARHIEFEADRFGLELTRQNAATAAMFAGFATQHLRTVEWDRFQILFYANHPSDGDRIRFANSYRPWAEGKPLVYSHVCSKSDQTTEHN